eukprot:6116781-Heterocapsa_arctica.AAC.1
MDDQQEQRVALERSQAASVGRAEAGGSASICLGPWQRRGRRLRLELPESAAGTCLRTRRWRDPAAG